MKALIPKQFGNDFSVQIINIEKPRPKDNEVLIEVEAAAMNRAELMILTSGPADLFTANPFMGNEVSGKISEIGSKVKKWKIGDRVAALMKSGGYAEYAIAHEDQTFVLPETMTYAEMAAVPEAFLLGYQLLSWIAQIKPKETVLIHAAASSMGSAAIQLAKAMGARVIGTCRDEKKVDFCRNLGAEVVIPVKNGEFSKEVLRLSDSGANVILDPVGQEYIAENLQALAPEGRLILYGEMGGEIERVNWAPILDKWASVIGSTLRPRSNEYKSKLVRDMTAFVVPLFKNKTIWPVVYTSMPMNRIDKAFEIMASNKNTGRIVLTKFES